MNRATTCILLVAVVNCACGVAPLAWGIAVRANEQAPDPTRFDADIRAFEVWDRQNSFPPGAILFVGSSSIRMWHTAECFPNLPVINRGFGGSHISDVNHFAERVVIKYAPRLIVFYAGDNDIEAGKSPQQVIDDFKAFVQLVRERLPKTPIYFISIKPSIARQKMWPEMKKANSLVQALSMINGQVIYVDVATPMLGRKLQGREPSAKKELFLDDGLHLNAKGYALWTDTLEPALRQATKRQ
jgi:lysophospholipase L1-like esterase